MVTILIAGCATNAAPSPQPARTVILEESAAAVALKPCTRVAPATPDSAWAPTNSGIRNLVNRVSLVLHSQPADDHGFRPLPLEQYVLGISGFTRGGRQWVYGSFAATDAAQDATPTLWPNWCDGSWRFFGVEYDVAADTIGPLVPNEGGYAQ